MVNRSHRPLWHACLVLLLIRSSRAETVVSQALDYLASHDKQFDEDLFQLGSIPSISSLSEHASDVLKAGEWVAARLKKAGLEVQLHSAKHCKCPLSNHSSHDSVRHAACRRFNFLRQALHLWCMPNICMHRANQQP